MESIGRNTNSTSNHNRYCLRAIYWWIKIQEKDFGRIQIARVTEMQKWAENIKNVQEDEHIKLAIITANNHYAGFGPGTVNMFRIMLGLPEAKWEEKENESPEPHPAIDLKQRSLSDFMS